MERYDNIIVGAGLYGLYSALYLGQQGKRVLILECEQSAFSRATYINQARVHQGYHYPRSISTALKSAGYFDRFNKDYSFCINKEFKKVYATSKEFSWSDCAQFQKFCKSANIPCEELKPEQFFKEGLCDGAFLTREYTYDAIILKNYFLEKISEIKNIKILYGTRIQKIEQEQEEYVIYLNNGNVHKSGFVINTSYASTNQILTLFGYETMKLKYELCEIILCNVNEKLEGYGFTVMDGPFFSIMPFGKTGLHSLTAVTFTPHATSYDVTPTFFCQYNSGGKCSSLYLDNCNECMCKPMTAFPYMANLARKYLNNDYKFTYKKSLFSMKPIFSSSEIDDSRPTVIKKYSSKPTFISVLSGKINTVYDLDEVLKFETKR